MTGSSIPPGMPFYHPAVTAPVRAVRTLLEYVETLPANATGSVEFEQGRVMLEHGRYCWALCGQPRQRLTAILRHQTSPSFIRDPGPAAPLILAEFRGDAFTTRQIATLSDRSMGLLDASSAVSGQINFAMATWQSGAAVAAWQETEITHVAVCDGPALAMVVGHLNDQRRAPVPHASRMNGGEREAV